MDTLLEKTLNIADITALLGFIFLILGVFGILWLLYASITEGISLHRNGQKSLSRSFIFIVIGFVLVSSASYFTVNAGHDDSKPQGAAVSAR